MNNSLKIYMVRHGQDEDNAKGILNGGKRDKSLTALGRQQAKELAIKIRELELQFDKVYSSPLKRAHETALIVSESNNFPQPEILIDLQERNFGVMAGKPLTEVAKLPEHTKLTHPNIPFTYFLKSKGSENFPTLLKRAEKVVSQLVNDSGNILLVAHGDIGKMVYAAYYKLSWEQVLTQFHFGNSDLILMSEDSPAEEAHVIKTAQYNK